MNRAPPHAKGKSRSVWQLLRCWPSLAALLTSALCATSLNAKDVRYQPTPMPVVRAMLQLAAVGPHDVVYDLGSGDGRIVITAAKEFGARGVGIDIDPDLVAQARANARRVGVESKTRFIQGNMFNADLRSATVVTLFLHPEPNLKLRPKLLAELPPGARVVSHVWDMGSWKPDAQRIVEGRRIFLWNIPSSLQADKARQ